MILVGRLTEATSARHLATMQRLNSRVLDLITGLPTLRGLGRSHGPAARVRELGEAHRLATMGSLRVAFLSGLVLELITTLSVAVVAVSMGFRLADGAIGIETALAVLVLAPEAYLPLRNVGAHFHASTDGLAAAGEAFRVLDLPSVDIAAGAPCPDLDGRPLRLTRVAVATPDGERLAPHGLSLTAKPGAVTALIGPNGDGKSTALMVAAGLLPPTAGTVAAGRDELAAPAGGVAADGWSAQVAWVPQRPDLGPAGRELSLGQRQRRELDRAFRSRRAWLLLDEPTAHLDSRSRQELIASIRSAADAGATVVVATHDPELISAADATVRVTASEVAS
jgi:ATP-binding cassette subfamily C protein CydD